MLIGHFLYKTTEYYAESFIFSSLYEKKPLQGKCIFKYLLLDSEKMAEMRYDQYTQGGRQIFFGYVLAADLLPFFSAITTILEISDMAGRGCSMMFFYPVINNQPVHDHYQ